MFQFRMFSNRMTITAIVAVGWLTSPVHVWAQSNIIIPQGDFQTRDILTSLNPQGMDVWGNYIAVYDSGLKVYDRLTETLVSDLGSFSYGQNMQYNSFVTFEPGGNALWVGYTVGGNVDDRIYRVALADATWAYKATLPANFDLAFHGDTPYVAGLNSTVWGGSNSLWEVDPSGGNNHSLVASVGGFAAGLAFDADGNLYYATNLGANDGLFRFSAEQVAQGNKQLADAEMLAPIPHPGTAVHVDSAGNVLVTYNEVLYPSWDQLSSTLALWNGEPDLTIVGDAAEDHWYTFVKSVGDVTQGGTMYLADGGAWFAPVLGVAEIQVPIPEPSTAFLLACGILGGTVGFRRRRSRRTA